MKGLLLKDFYLSWRYCRALFIIVAVFLCLSFVGEKTLFFQVYPMLLSSVIPVSLMGYDERDRWTAYSSTLPYTRGQLVSAKYLVGLCFGMAAFLVSMVAMAVRMQLMGWFSWVELATVGTTLLLLGCVTPALMLPVIFKFGVEKGRIAYFILIGLFSGVAAVLAGTGSQLQTLSGSMLPLAAIAGGSMVLYALSWWLSIRFYQKREL